MKSYSDQKQHQPTQSPLVPVGLVVLAILIVPMLIYSNGPEGPIKEGDVVFSTGTHRVRFAEQPQEATSGYQSFCVLEPRTRLIIIQKPAARTDVTLLAKLLGNTDTQIPFCPPKVQLVLHPRQVTLRADMWGGVKDTLVNLFSRS